MNKRFLLLSGLLLAACGGGSSGDTPEPPAPAPHEVTVSAISGSEQARLACNKGVANAECNIRLYQIMVEAYQNGDDTINYNTGYGTSHHKGDLRGIINSLDYIKGTGANAIWLTPIFQSIEINGQTDWVSRLDATGYFGSDYFKIDPKFGTKADLIELVDKAHAKGMYVFLDGVFGHFKSNIQASPTGKLPVVTNTCTGLGKTTTNTDTAQACADFSQTATLDFYKEVASYWINEAKIDGWRLDQAYQVPVGYWDDLKATVATASAGVTYTDANNNTVHPLGHMVAEIWGSEYDIKNYAFGSNAAPALSSSFDFPTRYRLVQTLATQEYTADLNSMNQPASTLNTAFNTFATYPDHAMPNLMLGNHDLVRFGDLIQRAGLGNPADDAYWNRHKAAFAFMAAYSGPITLYYGDEIGQEVANFAGQVTTDCAIKGLCDDHVARSSGITSGLSTQQTDLKTYVAKLWSLRDSHPALTVGSRTHIYSDSNVYIDLKKAGSDQVLFVLNAKTTPAIIHLKASLIGSPATLTDLVGSSNVTLSGDEYLINLPALGAAFYSF